MVTEPTTAPASQSRIRETALRVGTRGSALARTQTELVVSALRSAHPDLEIETVIVKTTGDRSRASLHEIGGQGAFTRELEIALLDGEIDVAVHSLKDLPSTVPAGLRLAGFPRRGTPNDVLISRDGSMLADLSSGARVGTGSLRRQAQLLTARPDLEVADIRGNVDTRLHKLEEGQYDAIVLAAAGVERMGWLDRATEILPPDVMLPAPSQAIIGLECRRDDGATYAVLRAINDARTEAAARAERAVLRRLGAGCRLPVGAYARPQFDGSLRLVARVLGFRGDPLLEEVVVGHPDDAEALGYSAADRLIARGAKRILESPLCGIRVLVTRPRSQAESFMQKLRDLGAKPALFPTIRIAPAQDRTPLERAVADIATYDWVIFTSQNAVDPFWECLTDAGLDAGALQPLKVGAIGPKTAAAVREHGITVDFVPSQYVAEAIVEEIDEVAGRRILLPRADIARPALLDGLCARGAYVNQVTAYRTVLAEPAESVVTQVLAGEIDVYTFTASSTVRNFMAILDEYEPHMLLQQATVAAIGPITAGTLAEYGIDADVVAEEHTIDGLIEALVENVQS